MANLVELFDNIVQMQALNGVPLANGKLYVYALGRTRLMDTWSDIDGESLNTNPIILDDAGQAHVYVSDDFDYTLVVCDAYNNEIFSIDKYLYSKGEHSHADVAVAPSEHIAVSSYHVGETTVYVPYIIGELGKTYHGIEPIVVNNQENKISARNIPLGVQEPLYFVEDSESACIIGASGLQPSGNYATVDWVLEHDYMQKEKLEFNESGQVTGFDGSAFAAGYVDPSDFIPWSASSTFQSAGNYATTEDLTAYQPIGNYYSASNPSGFINSDVISAMATTGFVADVSADITAMIPTALTGDYLTKDSADTLYQPLGDYATTADLTGKQDTLTFNYTETNEISGINGSGIYGLGSITGEYELSGGNGISIENDPINEKTIISVSGDYATNSDLQTVSGEITAMIPTALTGDYLTKDSADTLYYGIDNPSGFITGVDLTPYATTAELADVSGDITALIPSTAGLATTADVNDLAQSISETYQPIGDYQTAGDYYSASNPSGFITGVDLTPYQTTADMTAYQPVGDYLTTGDSANFYTTANESGFITGVDLTPYQTVEGMTAYQPVGDYYSASNPSGFITGVDLTPYQTTAEMTGYMTTAERADFYTTANESGFITGVPSESSGLWQTASEAVTANSGVWGGSALPVSAGKGVKISLQNDTLVFENDETVLFFAGNDSSGAQLGDLSESIMNFERIRVAGMDNDGHVDVKYIYPAWTKNADNFDATGYEVMLYGANPINNTVWEKWTRYSFSALTSFNVVLSYEGSYTANTLSDVTTSHKNSIREVIGINRISAGE